MLGRTVKALRWIAHFLAAIALALTALTFFARSANAQEACPADAACVSWSAVTLDTAGEALDTPVTYRVYAGARGASKTVAATVTALTARVPIGYGETCFVVTASTPLRGEGAPSSEACKSRAYARPAAPTVTVR